MAAHCLGQLVPPDTPTYNNMVVEIAWQHFTFQAETSRQPVLIPYSGSFAEFEINVNGKFTQALARPYTNNTVKQFSTSKQYNSFTALMIQQTSLALLYPSFADKENMLTVKVHLYAILQSCSDKHFVHLYKQ